jgi:hypothetical protein
MKVTARITPDSKIGKSLSLQQSIEATLNMDFGGDQFINEDGSGDYNAALTAAIEKFGSKAVYLQFEDGAVVSFQAAKVRPAAIKLFTGKADQETLQADAENWRIGQITRKTGNKVERTKKDVLSLGLADRQEMLRQIQESIQAELSSR